jgi:hypothetical protein
LGSEGKKEKEKQENSQPTFSVGPIYFFGRLCVSWHRLQRVFWELIIPPHFGQRRHFNFITWAVRGRIPITVLSPVFLRGIDVINFPII